MLNKGKKHKIKVMVYDGDALHGMISAETSDNLALSLLTALSEENLREATSKMDIFKNFSNFKAEVSESEIPTVGNVLDINEDVYGVLGGDIVIIVNASVEELTLRELYHNQVTLQPSDVIYIDTEGYIFFED